MEYFSIFQVRCLRTSPNKANQGPGIKPFASLDQSLKESKSF
ncbi:hypothetical protein A2U01_0083841, partial [Trifolium medium]|nr:hypothetical protein [Trifolium medium]